MIFSHKRRFIFVHIPKTAGIAIRMAIKVFVADAKGRVDNASGDVDHIEDYHHQTAREIKEQIGDYAYREYFTFGFVRNPWERMLSWYCMATQHDVPSLHRVRGLSFDQFLEMDEPVAHVMNNQIDYLCGDDGNPMVSFIGRFENLMEDWGNVARIIRVHPLLTIQNFTQHDDYHHYYNGHTKKIVADRFAKDIDYLGYVF